METLSCSSCGSQARSDSTCPVCDEISHVFEDFSQGDSEFFLHEIAHHLVLFRRLPKTMIDFREIGLVIDSMSAYDKQMTELRALAVERAGCAYLGAVSRIEAHLDPVWEGLEETIYEEIRIGRPIRGLPVTTKEEAARILSRLKPSPRHVARYVNFVLRRRAIVAAQGC